MISLFRKIFCVTLMISILLSTAFAQTYEVPVENRDGEADFARFELKNFSVTDDGRTLQLRYELPLELTGLINDVQLRGTFNGSQVVELVGDLGRATCDRTASTCRVRYENLQIDADRAEAIVRASTLDPKELAARLSVSSQFRADPIGTVKLP